MLRVITALSSPILASYLLAGAPASDKKAADLNSLPESRKECNRSTTYASKKFGQRTTLFKRKILRQASARLSLSFELDR